MKRYVFALLATFAFLPVSAEQIGDRFYPEPGSIFVASNGIFLNIEGELYGVTSLEADELGVYIPTPIAGYCGKHGYYPGSATVCPYCMAEKKPKK